MICKSCQEQVKNTMRTCPFCGADLPQEARSERTIEINVAPIADIVKEEEEANEEEEEGSISSIIENYDNARGVDGNEDDTSYFGFDDEVPEIALAEEGSGDLLPMVKRVRRTLEPAALSDCEREDVEYRKKRGMYSSELEMTNFALDEKNMMAEEEAELMEEKKKDLIQVFHNKEYHFDIEEEVVEEEIKIKEKEEVPVEVEEISEFEVDEEEEIQDEMGQELLEEKKKDLIQVYYNKQYHFDVEGKDVTYIDAEFVEDDEEDDEIEEGIPKRGIFSFIKRILSRK